MKVMLYDAFNNDVFLTKQDDITINTIHDAIPTRNFVFIPQSRYADCFKFAIVRDPIERLLSSYSNRVMFHRELDSNRVDQNIASALHLKTPPTIDEFLLNINEYRILSSSIRHHSDPTAVFLGPNLKMFDKIYRMSELPQILDDLKKLTGRSLSLPKIQKSEKKIYFNDLGKNAKVAALNFCMADYGYLCDYYAPPEY